MLNIDDPYQFSMDESINGTPRTRSSTRKQNNKKLTNKQKETNSKSDQQRIHTRSSQKSPLSSTHNQHDESFMSNINSGFSQFVNTKKRQREEKKPKTNKRTKVNTYADENEPPNDEIRGIEQVKLIYETDRGRTNLNRAAATNAQIVANRNASKSNTTYTINAIEDTQADTLAIPDTLANISTQLNDSSWQRDIDRLMKKLEEPPSTNNKSQTQIQETQFEDENNEQEHIEENIPRISSSPKVQIPSQRTTPLNKTKNTQPKTTTMQTNHMAIQTDSNSSQQQQQHQCCQDVSNCPCVIKYSKLERLFMEKMSQFISIVPNVSNTNGVQRENHFKRRHFPSSSRYRKYRGFRRINHQRSVEKNSDEINQSNQLEETSDQTIVTTSNETIDQTKEQNETVDEEQTTLEINQHKPLEHFQAIQDLSSIEKLDKTSIVDQTSTMLISTNTPSTARRLVLTTSSLDENQKSQFRLFLTRFNVSSSSIVDNDTTHIIVNENSPLVCPLTGKIIQGIARHLFIVSHRWLDECLNENSIIDERPFEIRGDTSLGSDHGGMRRSRLTPEYLLNKYSICLRCTSNDCAPLQNIEQVQELIQLTGAKLVKNFSEIKTLDNERQMILVLGVNGFAGGEKKRQILLDTCQQFNVRCVNIHWLLISIAKYEIQPFENYDINQN